MKEPGLGTKMLKSTDKAAMKICCEVPCPQAVLQQEDFFFCSGAGSVRVMPPVDCCGAAAAAARGRRSAMSLNTSATLTFVLALVSQKKRLFSSA